MTASMQPAGRKLAWELRPPVEGGADHAAYRAHVPQSIDYQQTLIAAPPTPGLTALHQVSVLQIQQQNEPALAEYIDGLRMT